MSEKCMLRSICKYPCPVEYKCAWINYGYSQALADAKAAVERIGLFDDYPINIITKAIAAITALEKEGK